MEINKQKYSKRENNYENRYNLNLYWSHITMDT